MEIRFWLCETIAEQREEGSPAQMIYAFGDCEFDSERYELRRGGDRQPVEPQVFDVLAYLIAHRDRVVAREELLAQVWGHTFVSDATLSSRLMAARKAKVIEVFSKRGLDPAKVAAAIIDSVHTNPAVRTVGYDAAVLATLQRIVPRTLARLGSRFQQKFNAV